MATPPLADARLLPAVQIADSRYAMSVSLSAARSRSAGAATTSTRCMAAPKSPSSALVSRSATKTLHNEQIYYCRAASGFQSLTLGRKPEPFSHPDWLYEVKWDGFRALLYCDEQGVRLVSRNGNAFKSFPELCEGLARDLRGRRCVLDGEIVCLDAQGDPSFETCCSAVATPFSTPSIFCGIDTHGRTMTRSGAGSGTARTSDTSLLPTASSGFAL
jgi:ATP dependent DNA ligase domain